MSRVKACRPCALLAALALVFAGVSQTYAGQTSASSAKKNNGAPGPADTYPRKSALLSVVSDPSGATVLVNGHMIGATPERAILLQPGEYRVTVEKKGYKQESSSVTLGPDDAVSLSFDMQKERVISRNALYLGIGSAIILGLVLFNRESEGDDDHDRGTAQPGTVIVEGDPF